MAASKFLHSLLSPLFLAQIAFSGRFRQAEQADYKLKMKNHLNVQYSGEFTVGGQVLPVIYDTGSFEVLVLSTRCNSCTESLQKYDDKKSSTFKDAGGKIAEHEFVSGLIVTEEGFETMRLGGANSPALVQGMTFWMVNRHEMDFWHEDSAIFSGIVGLSHVKAIPDGYMGDEMNTKYLLEEMHMPSFAMCLSRNSPEAPGWLEYGPSVNNKLKNMPGVFSSVNVIGDSHWATRLTSFKVADIDTKSLCKPSCSALIDSGTSLLTFPQSAQFVADKLTRMVKSDCSNINELPVLKFNLEGAEVSLPPRAYIYKGSDGTCQGAFMEADKDSQFGEVFVLGMPFLRYYYTIFDRANKQVHLARSKSNCEVVQANDDSPDHRNALFYHHTNDHFTSVGLEQIDFDEATPADLKHVLIPTWLTPDKGRMIHL
jgi:hypothetical protein